jgi:sulfatase maturation enzyme AslB (radical SAM superfamily)
MKNMEIKTFYYGPRPEKKSYCSDAELLAPPEQVAIETISDCNRKCHYCVQSKIARKKYLMPENVFTRIIDELSEWGFKGTLEPGFISEELLDERLVDLFAYAKKSCQNHIYISQQMVII